MMRKKSPLIFSGFILKLSFIAIINLLGPGYCATLEAVEIVQEESKEINCNFDSGWIEWRLRKLENDFLEQTAKESMAYELQASRLSKVEKQLHAQEEKYSAMETKQEHQFKKITQDFDSLKKRFFYKNSQTKRAADEKNTNTKKLCSFSSRTCTFFYPDHPDAIAAVKSNDASSYKATQNVLNSKEIPTVNGPPTNCYDLKQLGYILNGYYLVKKIFEDTNKIQTIYCDFNDLNYCLVSENIIGNVELKTKAVHFYVQRKSNYNGRDDAIPFQIEVLNIGGAMNLSSGIFTAPVPGTYYFAFSAVKDDSLNHLVISLQLNGKERGRAYTEHFNQNPIAAIKTKATLSLTSSLYLKAGDQVKMRNEYGGKILDQPKFHHTHFTGWLVSEDLASA